MKHTSFIPLIAAAVLSTSLTIYAQETTEGLPANYPLKKCVVSGEEFGGEMGKPVKVTHNGTDVYLCCKACLKDFKKDPDKYTKMVTDAKK
jgi:hypothetical protein